MKLRYQLRGLGIGIILAALLTGIVTKDGRSLSDAEIRARALELGMTDNDNRKLTDLPQAASEPEGDTVSGNTYPENVSPSGSDPGEDSEPAEGELGGEGVEPEKGESEGENTDLTEGESGEGAGLGEMESREINSPDSSEQGNAGDFGSQNMETGSENVRSQEIEGKVAIVIEPGITSLQVCIMLAEAGLVGDADEFDRYLCDNGYSTSLRHGAYEIAAGTSREEIIRILTGGR